MTVPNCYMVEKNTYIELFEVCIFKTESVNLICSFQPAGQIDGFSQACVPDTIITAKVATKSLRRMQTDTKPPPPEVMKYIYSVH
jgi:hypothetical protein